MNILITDDNSTNLKLLRAMLETEGHKVLSANDGLEALELLEREKIEVVISDILMPRMDGYRFCLEVRKSEKFKALPFIFYTATYTSPSDSKAAMDLGADDFLKKPAPVAEIAQALRKSVERAPHRLKRKGHFPEELDLMKEYNARLVAKLEKKNLELLDRTEDLQKHQQQLLLQTTALEAAANAIMITEPGGTILSVNPAFTLLTGYSASEALGQNPRMLKSDVHDRAFYHTLWQTILQGETWRGELTNRRKNGSLYCGEQTITPVRGPDGQITHFVGIMNDVTERKRLEEQFIQSQKMEDVGHLAGGIAHDFNNILAVIIGYSDLMNLELGPDNRLHKHVREIRHAADRAAALTQQLLIFTRKQKLQPAVLDLNQILASMDKMLRRLTDENIALSILPGKEIGRFKADGNHVGQILMNLVINARDAMPNGGKLKIETRKVALNEAYSRAHPEVPPGDYILLAVTDTGTGMTDEVKSHLFEPFFTTKPRGKGTGLGLATCLTIAKQSQSHIDCESKPGQGTTFRVYFPCVDQPLDPQVQSNEPVALPRGSETLLLVEDERSVRHLAYEVLEHQGYTVMRATNGQEALNAVRRHKGPPIRLVVTDVIMPQMGGKVMAEWLKATYPDLKILFTSGYTDEAIAHHGVLDPGVAFLPKPYTPATLVRKVREMLDASETSGAA